MAHKIRVEQDGRDFYILDTGETVTVVDDRTGDTSENAKAWRERFLERAVYPWERPDVEFV